MKQVTSTVGGLYGTSSSSATTRDDQFRIGKHRAETGGDDEMQAVFAKLMHLVPTIPPNGENMSKVQLLQHVIDYILDLENTLDFQPATTDGVVIDQNDADMIVTAPDDGGALGQDSSTSIEADYVITRHSSPAIQWTTDKQPLTENPSIDLQQTPVTSLSWQSIPVRSTST